MSATLLGDHEAAIRQIARVQRLTPMDPETDILRRRHGSRKPVPGQIIWGSGEMVGQGSAHQPDWMVAKRQSAVANVLADKVIEWSWNGIPTRTRANLYLAFAPRAFGSLRRRIFICASPFCRGVAATLKSLRSANYSQNPSNAGARLLEVESPTSLSMRRGIPTETCTATRRACLLEG